MKKQTQAERDEIYRYNQRQLNILAVLYVLACVGILGFFGWKFFA